MWSIARSIAIVGLATLCSVRIAGAADYYWSDPSCPGGGQSGSNLFVFAQCWSVSGPNSPGGDGPPVSGAYVHLLNGTDAPIVTTDDMPSLVLGALDVDGQGAGRMFLQVGALAVTGTTRIGIAGTGGAAVDQYSGNATFATLVLGDSSTGAGYYNLHAGTLTAQDVTVGNGGTGAFQQGFQTGTGIVQISGTLSLGAATNSSGTYSLYDGTSLGTGQLVVGGGGQGSFAHFGGTNTVSGNLTLGPQGSYQLYAGNLNVGGDVVGTGGNGTLFLEGGTLTVGGNLRNIPQFSMSVLGGNATFTLGGTQSLAAASEVIGGGGNATLTQMGTSSNATAGLSLGSVSGGTGAGVYELSGGTLQATSLGVGVVSSGTLHQTGGSVISRFLNIGVFAGSSGTYRLEGGSLLSTSDSQEQVGQDGVGQFIQTGGSNTATSLGIGAQGTYTLSGGTLTLAQDLIGASSGTFVLDGGTLNVGGDINLGALIVTAGNTLNVPNNLHLSGLSSFAGTVNVANVGFQNAGNLTITGTLANAGTSTVDNLPNALMQVNGAGSLYVSTVFTNHPQATLAVGGGSVLNDTPSQFFNQGQVTATGTGTFTNAGAFTNNGTTQVAGAAASFVNTGSFANQSGGQLVISAGTLRNTGSGANLSNDQFSSITIDGANGPATLTNDAAAGLLNEGQLTVSNGGQVVNHGHFQNNGTVTIDANSSFVGTGTYLQASGLTKVFGVLSQANIVMVGGVFGGSGTVNGTALDPNAPPVNFYMMGGAIKPGDPVRLTIDGNLFFSGGLLDIQVAGPDQLDQLVVTGLASFTGGTVELDFINGFLPHKGDVFNFLLSNAASFSDVVFEVGGLGSGFEYSVDAGADGFSLVALNDGVSPVPMPSGLWLFGSGALLLVCVVRPRPAMRRTRHAE